MKKRKTFGEGLAAGSACVVVTEKGLGKNEHPFWNWLREEGFHSWLHHGNYGMDWIFINLNSMIYAPGMPGIRIVGPIREHAITVEEFKTIWGIYMQYEGLSVLQMPEDVVIALAQDKDGKLTEYKMTVEEAERLLQSEKKPTIRDLAKDKLVQEWLKNPAWREYYEKAPSEECKEVIRLEFLYSELETDELGEQLDEAEKELKLEDWRHLYRYCGNNPRKKFIYDRIAALGGE